LCYEARVTERSSRMCKQRAAPHKVPKNLPERQALQLFIK
jgi:hypothetical protein